MRQNRPLAFTAIILILAIGNFIRIKGNENIRPIQFVSILVIGMLAGILLREIIGAVKNRRP